MKVIWISGSSRKNGNTTIIIKTFFEELNRAGIETELIQLADIDIQPCRACIKAWTVQQPPSKIDWGKCPMRNDRRLARLRAPAGLLTILQIPCYSFQVLLAPFGELIEYWYQWLTQFGKFILGAWRHLGIEYALDKPDGFKSLQMSWKYFWRNVRNGAWQFVEPHDSELIKNDEKKHRPLVGEMSYHVAHGTRCHAWIFFWNFFGLHLVDTD